jgi:CBS domain-containing protein
MAQYIREIMTASPITLSADRPVSEAAVAMKENGIGDVMVTSDGVLCGLVTDRDLVVRVLAEGRDPNDTLLQEVCSRQLITLGPDDAVKEAVALIRQHAVRRIPVVEGGTPVGVITIGDLALERDEASALADVSAAAANT